MITYIVLRKNLNHILAWAHAKAIQNTLAQVPCHFALSDQFGDASLVRNALIQKGLPIVLYQRPKAEDNIAVAAASVIARAHFLTELKKLSDELGFPLPKGSSDQTKNIGRELVKKFGEEVLQYSAKLHFKLTEEILS